jgi:defect in organelle trafficking protein DotC
MPKFIRNLGLILTVLCMGCSSNQQVGNTDSLEGLKEMHSVKSARAQRLASMGKIREMALKEIALSIGAQSGLAGRAKYIDNELTKQNRRLDAIYDFNALILEHNILPPVLLEGKNTLNLADAQTIRISDHTYKVAKQARFITAAPNWRQYLWMDFLPPEYPNASLLPKTHAERVIWKRYVERGWKNGVEQADSILEESIARIKEDFKGMILYRKLLAMNMISPPYVSSTDLGVTGDGDEIYIDDRVLRITALPSLNVNSKEWRAAVAKDENTLEQYRQMEHMIKTNKIHITNNSWQPVITPTH